MHPTPAGEAAAFDAAAPLTPDALSFLSFAEKLRTKMNQHYSATSVK
jgi:hypothetical protein